MGDQTHLFPGHNSKCCVSHCKLLLGDLHDKEEPEPEKALFFTAFVLKIHKMLID